MVWFAKATGCAVAAMAVIAVLGACENRQELSMGTDIRIAQPPGREFVVGVGETVGTLAARNPYLESYGLSDHMQLRLSLDSEPIDVIYDDASLKFRLTAARVSADGIDRVGVVTHVGAILSPSFSNDPEAVLAQAVDLIREMESENAGIIRLDSWYRAASSEQIDRFEGKRMSSSWRSVRTPVETQEALDLFKGLVSRIEQSKDYSRESMSARASLAIFESETVIVTVGVSANKEYGGQNLTPTQDRSLRFVVGVEVRAKPYSGWAKEL